MRHKTDEGGKSRKRRHEWASGRMREDDARETWDHSQEGKRMREKEKNPDDDFWWEMETMMRWWRELPFWWMNYWAWKTEEEAYLEAVRYLLWLGLHSEKNQRRPGNSIESDMEWEQSKGGTDSGGNDKFDKRTEGIQRQKQWVIISYESLMSLIWILVSKTGHYHLITIQSISKTLDAVTKESFQKLL